MDVIGGTILAVLPAAQAAVQAVGEATAGAGGVSAADFTVQAMFLRATLVVQVVMVLLVLASVWSWGIIIDKATALRRLGRQIRGFEERFWSGRPLEELYAGLPQGARSPAERVFAAGWEEWQRSQRAQVGLMPGTQQRVERAMNVAIARESERVGARLSFLATTGSVSPFVGLFGTVWGIKHSFEAIAVQQNTNLAVVAPGIAEALFATALGLLAAIPAVVAYNRLSADSDRLTGQLENFADEFSTILGREIDRGLRGAA